MPASSCVHGPDEITAEGSTKVISANRAGNPIRRLFQAKFWRTPFVLRKIWISLVEKLDILTNHSPFSLKD